MSTFDIFQLGRVLAEKFPGLASLDEKLGVAAIDLAIEDIGQAGSQLEKVVSQLRDMKPGDVDQLTELLIELRELFNHTEAHVVEAQDALDQVLRVIDSEDRQVG